MTAFAIERFRCSLWLMEFKRSFQRAHRCHHLDLLPGYFPLGFLRKLTISLGWSRESSNLQGPSCPQPCFHYFPTLVRSQILPFFLVRLPHRCRECENWPPRRFAGEHRFENVTVAKSHGSAEFSHYQAFKARFGFVTMKCY